MARSGKQVSDRGAILITILLIVTIMATVAVAVLDDIRFGVRRTEGSQTATQAHWYALGAEMLAKQALTQTFALSSTKTDLSQPWATQSGQFFVPGGLIDARLEDATGCLNVNSLVAPEDGGQLVASEDRQWIFLDLFRDLGIADGEAERLMIQITDWIDTDTQIGPSGAEDFDYLVETPPYRTGNTLIADMTTLRSIEAVTPDLYALLSGFLCPHPTTDFIPINLNTLDPERGRILVAALLGPEVAPLDIDTLLAQRPETGFERLEDVWGLDILAGKDISEDRRALFDVRSQYFTLNTRVIYGETDKAMTSFFEIQNTGGVRLISRQFGEDF